MRSCSNGGREQRNNIVVVRADFGRERHEQPLLYLALRERIKPSDTPDSNRCTISHRQPKPINLEFNDGLRTVKNEIVTVQSVGLSSVQRESPNRSRQLLPLLIAHVCPRARLLTY